MSYLNREQFLSLQDKHTYDLPLPDGLGTVRIRALTTAETEEFNRKCEQAKLGGIASSCLIACYALVDAEGNRLFDPNKQEDVDLIRLRLPAVVLHIGEAINRLSAGGLHEVEKYIKNWSKTQSDGLNSASAST